MAEEPEHVLPQQDSAVGWIKYVCAKVTVGGQPEQRGRQQRERHQHHDAGDQDVPGEDRHPEHRHARRAQAHHGGDHVDPAEYGAQPTDDESHYPQITSRPRGMDRVGKRGVRGPAEVRWSPGGNEARQGD
jgi:hypothetical protein